MSDVETFTADVFFQTMNYEPCPSSERPARFGFRCPYRNRGRNTRLETILCEGLLIANGPYSAIHSIHRDGTGKKGTPQWNWNGNREAPTFTPSINCKHCGWHGYIRDGRCVTA